MAGGYLPPVVATLVGEAADALAKIAEVKTALEDLSKTATEVPITADITEALAQIAELKADAQSLGGVAIPVSINDGQALYELEAMRIHLELMAKLMAIDIPVQVEMGSAIAEFLAGTAAMKAAADTAGRSGGGSELMGAILWGTGGTFGFAAFGSVLSLAGFGFEHLVTTVLGLAGSLAGALVGGLTLASAAFAVMGVGMATDMAGIGQAAGDIQQYTTLQNNLNQAIAVYGANSTEAALAQYQMNQWMKDLAPSTVAAIKAASATAASFHAMFDSVTSDAETTGAQIINQAMQIGEKFLPTIGTYAAQNLGIIQADLQPLFAWLSTTGLSIFSSLEQKFQTDLPYAMGAFDNGIELLIKILGYAAQSTGNFMKWLDQFFTKWNSAASWPSVANGINTVIGMFHTWWDLLKQIGITLYDLFDKSLGLGTSIVSMITTMLVKLDAWLGATKNSNSSVSNLFQAHLAEIHAILNVLPLLLSDFGQLYLIIAPDLTKIVTGLVNVIDWMMKIPGAGQIIGWAGAVALLLSKMIGLRNLISGFKDLTTLFQALNAGASFKDAISIAFGNTSAIASNTSALGILTDAVATNTDAQLGKSVTGIAGDTTAGATAAAGVTDLGEELPALALSAGTFETILGGMLGPLGLAALGVAAFAIAVDTSSKDIGANRTSNSSPVVQGAGTGGALSGVAGIQQAYAATWSALLESTNAVYKTSGLFQQNLQTDLAAAGVPLSLVAGDATIIAADFADGKIKTQAQLQAVIKNLLTTGAATGAMGSAAQAAAIQAADIKNTYIASASLVGASGDALQTAMINWINALEKTGVDQEVAQVAESNLAAFVKVHGPLTQAEMLAFQFMATDTHANAAAIATETAALSAFVKAHGPPTMQELGFFETSVTAAHGDGALVAANMKTLSNFVAADGPPTANELKALQTAVTSSAGNAGTMNADVAILAQFIHTHGPLTAIQLGMFQTAVTTSAGNSAIVAADMGLISSWTKTNGALTVDQLAAIKLNLSNAGSQTSNMALDLKLIADALAPAPTYAQDIATALKNGSKINPHYASGAPGGYASGGVANAATTGTLAYLHGVEAVVPKSKAGWLWDPMLHAIATGKPPSLSMPSAAGGGTATSGGSLGGPQISVSLVVQVPPGTPAQVANNIGVLAQAAVNKALGKVGKQMGAGSKQYAFLPS